MQKVKSTLDAIDHAKHIVMRHVDLVFGLGTQRIVSFSNEFMKVALMPEFSADDQINAFGDFLTLLKEFIQRKKKNEVPLEEHALYDGKEVKKLVESKILSFSIDLEVIFKNYDSVRKIIQQYSSMSRVLTESEREMMTILKDYEIALSPFIQTIWNEKGRDLNIEDTLAIARYCQVFPRIILKKLEESSKNLNSNY